MQDLIYDSNIVFLPSDYLEDFFQMMIQSESFGKRLLKISNQLCQIIPDKNPIEVNIAINDAIRKFINFLDLCQNKFNFVRNLLKNIFDVKVLNKKNLEIYSKLILGLLI